MNNFTFNSPAKINLGLQIGEKFANGKHRLQTVMVKVPLFDEIELIWQTDKNSTIFCANKLVPNNSNNLILRAFSLLQADFSLPGVHINLKKKIPVGSGLGGGSFNAGTLLRVLNKELKLNLTQNQLLGYAQKLGSDVPFAVIEASQVLEKNHGGENLQQIVLPPLPPCHLVIVTPQIEIYTASAFALWDQKNKNNNLSDLEPLIRACQKQDLKNITQNLNNDFEEVIFAFCPQLAQIKEDLLQAGALGASMSGSG
ncbi:MAG: 4-(cytidine 5'-diphospho)-2-C-methyl-D-erythritol kinase, partial [bacterium]|nr:4-(cytidine 5'-diphospho)-2-C-methyl-D-erythritol kinase [bacterium]